MYCVFILIFVFSVNQILKSLQLFVKWSIINNANECLLVWSALGRTIIITESNIILMIVPFTQLSQVIDNISSVWACNVWGSQYNPLPYSGGTQQTAQTQTNKQESSKSVLPRPWSSVNETEPREQLLQCQPSHVSLLSWQKGKVWFLILLSPDWPERMSAE